MFGGIHMGTWPCFTVLQSDFGPVLPFFERHFGVVCHRCVKQRIRQLLVVVRSVDEALLGGLSIEITGNGVGRPDSLFEAAVTYDPKAPLKKR